MIYIGEPSEDKSRPFHSHVKAARIQTSLSTGRSLSLPTHHHQTLPQSPHQQVQNQRQIHLEPQQQLSQPEPLAGQMREMDRGAVLGRPLNLREGDDRMFITQELVRSDQQQLSSAVDGSGSGSGSGTGEQIRVEIERSGRSHFLDISSMVGLALGILIFFLVVSGEAVFVSILIAPIQLSST